MKIFVRKGKPWLQPPILNSGDDSRGIGECHEGNSPEPSALFYWLGMHVQGTERQR